MSTTKNTPPPAKDPEKTVDLPPYGPRNPDPITDAPGSHPIETGVGAVLEGAVEQRLEVAPDRGQRRPELVRDVADELGAHATPLRRVITHYLTLPFP